MTARATLASSASPVLGFLFLAVLIGGAIMYQNWLVRGLRARVIETSMPADQLRRIFTDKVANLGWKVVDADNPMVAQSPLIAGRRQQIGLTMTKTERGIRCEIKPLRVWTKGWGRRPYKAHTLRLRMNAFERAVQPLGGMSGVHQPGTQTALRPPPPPVAPAPAALAAPPAVSFVPPVVRPPTALIDSLPRPAPPVVAPPDDHDGHTMTRADHEAMRRASAPPTLPSVSGFADIVIRLDTGIEHVISGTTLLGRDPSPRAGESVAGSLRIVDDEHTVSKTHLALRVEQGSLVIEDRDSVNGTLVRDPHGAEIEARPGVAVTVPAGSTVHIGDRFFTIQRREPNASW